MKSIFLLIPLIFLLAFCQSPTGKQKEQLLDSIRTEGYSLEAEDEESLDFSGEKSRPGELEQTILDAGLVNIKEVIPEVHVELKYSTTDNFFDRDVYGDLENCYVQPVVAEMLLKAHTFLQEAHPEITFMIYDGVRPLSVQQILWDYLDKPDSIKFLYVADPKEGSLHNFGVALDLTLAYADTGEVLDMGTGYDFFGFPAYPDREDQMIREGKITQEQVSNRKILRNAMNHAGFKGIGSEWWHFNAFDRKIAGEKFKMIK